MATSLPSQRWSATLRKRWQSVSVPEHEGVKGALCDHGVPTLLELEAFATTVRSYASPRRHIPAWWIDYVWQRNSHRCTDCHAVVADRRNRRVAYRTAAEPVDPHCVTAMVPCCETCRRYRRAREAMTHSGEGLVLCRPHRLGGFLACRANREMSPELYWELRWRFHATPLQRPSQSHRAQSILFWLKSVPAYESAIATVIARGAVVSLV
jgi:hypothetical protein